MKMNRFLASLGAMLLTLAVLVSVIDGCCFDRSFYAREYEQNSTTEETGLTLEGLNNATEVLLDYLQDKRDDISLQEAVNGTEREVFDEREKAHMVDVKELYQKALVARNIAFAAGLVLLVIAVCREKVQRKIVLRSGWTAGVMLLFAAVGAILIAACVDFDSFWRSFHELFFDNDLWLMDPNTEIMINMVPGQFFYDLVIRIIVIFLGILTFSTAGIYWFTREKKA